jgi:hypothetical protein
MNTSNLIPVLAVVKNNVIFSVTLCKSAEQLEKAFKKECANYGVTPNDDNFDDGYMELENNVSIGMTWSSYMEDLNGNRNCGKQ